MNVEGRVRSEVASIQVQGAARLGKATIKRDRPGVAINRPGVVEQSSEESRAKAAALGESAGVVKLRLRAPLIVRKAAVEIERSLEPRGRYSRQCGRRCEQADRAGDGPALSTVTAGDRRACPNDSRSL